LKKAQFTPPLLVHRSLHRFRSQIPVIKTRHVWAAQFFSALRTYPDPLLDSSKDYRTYPVPGSDITGHFLDIFGPWTGYIWLLSLNPGLAQTPDMSCAEADSRDSCRTCPAPDTGHVRVSDTPMGRFLLGAIKGPHAPLLSPSRRRRRRGG
jgi:hypothetical protein